MLVCDRCGDNAKYRCYVGGKEHDLCVRCERLLNEIEKDVCNIEQSFMRNEFDGIKHIDFDRKVR